MKKFIFWIAIILLCTGCNEKETTKEKQLPEKKEEQVEKVEEEKSYYQDNNPMKMGIYKMNGNHLNLITNDNSKKVPLEDIGIFQILPVKEEQIETNSFGNLFYEKWTSYEKHEQYKIGFHIYYQLENGEEISYNILKPSETNAIYSDYLLVYLYDDYHNLGKNFYSHLEEDTDAYYTSIKLQWGGYGNQINTPIDLDVFSYDTEDDFENNQYRGNSSYKIKIIPE